MQFLKILTLQRLQHVFIMKLLYLLKDVCANSFKYVPTILQDSHEKQGKIVELCSSKADRNRSGIKRTAKCIFKTSLDIRISKFIATRLNLKSLFPKKYRHLTTFPLFISFYMIPAV